MTTHLQTQPLDNWAAMFRAAPVAICLASLTDGMILDCNQRYEELTGVPREELIGRPAADLHVVASAEAREQIATALDEQAAAFEVASQLRLPNGTLRATLSSLRVVEFDNEPAVLSVTTDNEAHAQQDAAARVEAKALTEQLTRLEREIARHNEREQRLISQIGGLVDQAGLLKSDVMRLKSLQQELNAEIEGLRKYGDRYRGDATTTVPGAEPADARRAVSAPKTASQANEPIADLIAARLAAFEEQLQGHVAALRAQAAKLQADTGHQ
jgi:PAS domain S-box-containing protein